MGPVRADELSDALNQQQDLQKEQSQAREKLSKITYTEETLKKQLTQLAAQVTAAARELKQKEDEVSRLQAQIEETQAELEQRQKELEERRAALGQRMRGIYEDGQVSYLEVLFQSSSLNDLITRIEYLSCLVDNDRQILTGIQQEKEKVEIKTAELETQRDEAVKIREQEAAVKADLDSKKAQQQQVLNETKKAEDDLLTQIEKLEAESKAIANLVRQLSASLSNSGNQVTGTVSFWPLDRYFEISSPFGWRIHPITKARSLHTGTDIPAPTGTPIKAAGAGVVIYTAYQEAFGNMVIIDHGSGYTTLYAHQSKIAATVNQQVKAGDVIGYVGTTGWSTGPHLHFELRINGEPTNVMPFFPNL
jgi:murein DD-endopeptidase MepM/ murein hydrolase activator NlpD